MNEGLKQALKAVIAVFVMCLLVLLYAVLRSGTGVIILPILLVSIVLAILVGLTVLLVYSKYPASFVLVPILVMIATYVVVTKNIEWGRTVAAFGGGIVTFTFFVVGFSYYMKRRKTNSE